MVNTLYIKTPTRAWVDTADYAHKNYGWEPVLWVGSEGSQHDFDSINDENYYAHEDAMLANAPAFMDEADWDALDANMLQDMAWHQPIFHEMCNRWFVNPDEASYKIRAQYYNRMLEVWLNIFKHCKIDLVVSPAIPHRVYDYVAYMVAKSLGVPFLMVDTTASMKPDESGDLDFFRYIIDDIFERTHLISKAYEKAKKDVVVTQYVHDYEERVLSEYEKAVPNYVLEKERRLAQRGLDERLKEKMPALMKIAYRGVKDVVAGQFFDRKYKYEFQPYFTNNSDVLVQRVTRLRADLFHRKINKKTQEALDWLHKNCSQPSLDEPYVLFAASKQPERSTCPDAGHYYNSIDIIQSLASTLPEGWKIYYKEHPSNFRRPWGMDSMRSAEFYEAIRSSIPNVVFLPLKSDPFLYIDHARVTATATGSVAWEGILKGKPGIIFGSTWYENCSGIFKIKGLEDLQATFEAIQKGIKPNREDTLKYIEFFGHVKADIEWRRQVDFGLDPDKDTKEYKARVAAHAQAYKDAYDTFLNASGLTMKAQKIG